jgi:hypothetical protein
VTGPVIRALVVLAGLLARELGAGPGTRVLDAGCTAVASGEAAMKPARIRHLAFGDVAAV